MKAIDTGNNEPITIWWIKRDFRLYDNEVLAEAINSGNSILPLFVFEPNIMQSSDFSAMHLYAQISASSDLRLRLQAIGVQALQCVFLPRILLLKQVKILF